MCLFPLALDFSAVSNNRTGTWIMKIKHLCELQFLKSAFDPESAVHKHSHSTLYSSTVAKAVCRVQNRKHDIPQLKGHARREMPHIWGEIGWTCDNSFGRARDTNTDIETVKYTCRWKTAADKRHLNWITFLYFLAKMLIDVQLFPS